MADAYTPSDGLKNIVSFPTDPADEAAARKQIQDMFDQILALHNAHMINYVLHNIGYWIDYGSTDDYAIIPTPALTAYAAGQFVTFYANTINTTSGATECTLNVSSLGAKIIKDSYGNKLPDGAIPAASVVTVMYDGTYFRMLTPISTQYMTYVYHNATQSIAASTLTALAFNSEYYDTAIMHDNATNNTRITITQAGKYEGYITVAWADDATGYRQVLLRKNGATYLSDGDTRVPITGNVTCITLPIPATTFALNDYLEAVVRQTTAGALNVNTCSFMLRRVSS